MHLTSHTKNINSPENSNPIGINLTMTKSSQHGERISKLKQVLENVADSKSWELSGYQPKKKQTIEKGQRKLENRRKQRELTTMRAKHGMDKYGSVKRYTVILQKEPLNKDHPFFHNMAHLVYCPNIQKG
jgi:hypothetical protein